MLMVVVISVKQPLPASPLGVQGTQMTLHLPSAVACGGGNHPKHATIDTQSDTDIMMRMMMMMMMMMMMTGA
jgi:hypothetical protein